MVPFQMSIKTSSAKGKGRKFQNHVRDAILKRFEWLGEGDVGSCSMGSSGEDIPMSPIARRTIPISIECKKTRKHPAMAEMKQARANAKGIDAPAIAWSPHGSGPKDCMITFNLEDFLDFYEMVAEERLAEIWGQEERKNESDDLQTVSE